MFTFSLMKVVILSDMNWREHLRDLTWQQANSFTEDQLHEARYERIARYFEIIISEKADLVLLAGDITGDGFCGHGYQYALLSLLSLLEKRHIPSAFITGNHDPDPYFEAFLNGVSTLHYTQHISNALVNIEGLNVLGINFYCTKSKSSLNKLLKKYKDNSLDICLAHSEIKRRIRLFDTNASLIVTGHYDRKLFPFRDSIFISLDNDSSEVSYATAVFESGRLMESKICIRKDEARTIYLPHVTGNIISPYLYSDTKVVASFEQLESANDESFLDEEGNDWTYLKYLRGRSHQSAYISMFSYKKNKEQLDEILPIAKLKKLKISPGYRISSLFIRDYLGKIKK